MADVLACTSWQAGFSLFALRGHLIMPFAFAHLPLALATALRQSFAFAFCCGFILLRKGSIPCLRVMLCPVVCFTNKKYLRLRAGMESRKDQLLSATCCKPCTLPAAD